jgi:hypothetical protein
MTAAPSSSFDRLNTAADDLGIHFSAIWVFAGMNIATVTEKPIQFSVQMRRFL